jgi:hypothetical protein
MMKKLLVVILVLFLTGCVTTSKVNTGENTLGGRLVVKLEGPWNQINAPGMGPAQIWTMEGLPIDQLLIYTGLKDGEAIHDESSAGKAKAKSFKFRSSMEPDEIVALFEGMFTRDGSVFKLLKLKPADFAGSKGFYFEYSLTRKSDNVTLLGLGYGSQNKGELFAMVYQAPRLTFFSRYQSTIDKIAQSAFIKAN